MNDADILTITREALEELYQGVDYLVEDYETLSDLVFSNLGGEIYDFNHQQDVKNYVINKGKEALSLHLKKELEQGNFCEVVERLIRQKGEEEDLSSILDSFVKGIEYNLTPADMSRLLESETVKQFLSKQLEKKGESNDFTNDLLEAHSIINSLEDEEDMDFPPEDIVNLYLKEISVYPTLSKEEEKALFYALKNGDVSAKAKLIHSNLQYVVSVAKRHQKRGVPFLDLIQVGNIALMDAIDHFDVERGNRLSTYAYWKIFAAITLSIKNDKRMIRPPKNITDKQTDYYKACDFLRDELKREPTTEEVASKLGMTVKEVDQLSQLLEPPLYFNAFINDNEDNELGDIIADDKAFPEEEIIERELQENVQQFLENSNLTRREIEILKYRFGFFAGRPMAMSEVGNIYHMTRQGIDQIEKRALEKLRCDENVFSFSNYMDGEEKATSNIKAYQVAHQKTVRKVKKKKIVDESINLNQLEFEILKYYCGIAEEGAKTLEEISAIYQISVPYTRRFMGKGMRKIKQSDDSLNKKLYQEMIMVAEKRKKQEKSTMKKRVSNLNGSGSFLSHNGEKDFTVATQGGKGQAYVKKIRRHQ